MKTSQPNQQATITQIVFAIIALTTTVHGEIISNGSFETPAIAPNTFQQATPTGWAWNNTPGRIFNGNVNPAIWPTPQDGQQFVDIGNSSTFGIRQSFTIATAGTYTLTWQDSCGLDLGAPTQSSPYAVALLDSSLAVVASANKDAIHPRVWVPQQLSANLNAGTYTVRFTPQGPSNGLDTLIDNVKIIRAQSSWNISQGYSATNNPNAPWSYGRKATVSDLTMDLFTVPWGSSGWYLGNIGNGGPSVQSGPIMWAKANGNGYPCGRWTCPKTGKYDIQGKFTGSDPRGVDNFVYVVINGSIRFSSRVQADQQSAPFALRQVSLNMGDFVDFTLVWGGGVNSEYGWTDVDAVINRVPTRDLNNDGNADLVFQNDYGQITTWYMNGSGAATGHAYLSTAALGDWKVAGVADMNGDGLSDFLFQNGIGQTSVWYLNASGAITGSAYISSSGLGDWRLVATADIDGDGNTDLLFQNNYGQIGVWYMNGLGGVTTSAYLSTAALGDWRVRCATDLNSDGVADLVFQNGAGLVSAWRLNTGGSVANSGYLYTGALGDWKVTGAADLNGDSIPDLLFQNNYGQIIVWYMNGNSAFTSAVYLSTSALGDWRLR